MRALQPTVHTSCAGARQLTRPCRVHQLVRVGYPCHAAAPLQRWQAAERSLLLIRAAQAGGSSGNMGDGGDAVPPPSGGGGGDGPGAISLGRPMAGPGYTFTLAGLLKILTMGGLAVAAPNEAMRTAVGQYSQYLMVPVGLGLCWLAKQAVDADLHNNTQFLRAMTVALFVLYFGLVRVLYTAVPGLQPVRRSRPLMPGPMAEMRAQMGDRYLAGPATSDGIVGDRAYQPEKPGPGELYDDLAWYEGRYPSQLKGGGAAKAAAARRGSARGADSEGLLSEEGLGAAQLGSMAGDGEVLRGQSPWDMGGDGMSDASGGVVGRRPVKRSLRARNSRSFLSSNER